jgi:hypothetical protein
LYLFEEEASVPSFLTCGCIKDFFMETGFSVYDFQQYLRTNHVIFAFKGVMTHDILHGIADSIKKRNIEDHTLAKRVFSIFIELAQNIHLYSADRMFSDKDNRDIGAGTITISESSSFYELSSGNLVDASAEKGIMERCDLINSMSPEDLKKFYKDARKKPVEGSQGGNVGFIDMARKSGNPLVVRMDSVDEKLSFFTLSVRVDKT